MRAYDFTTPKSAGYLNAWAQEHDPFANAGREAIAVSVLNVVPRSAKTYDIQWHVWGRATLACSCHHPF